MIISMTHLEIVGLREELHNTIKSLQELGVTHIHETHPRESRGGRFLKTVAIEDKKAGERKKLEAMENLLKEMMPVVRTYHPQAERGRAYLEDTENLDETLWHLEADRDKLNGLSREKNEADASLEMARKYREVLNILPEVLAGSQATKAVDYFAITIEKSDLPELKSALAHAIEGTVAIRTAKWRGATLIGVVSFPTHLAEDVKDVTWKHGATEIVLPSEFLGRPVRESVQEIEQRLGALPEKINSLEKEMASYVARHGARIERIHQEIEDALDRFRLLGSVGESKYLFVLSIWTPADQLISVKKALKDEFRDKVSLNELETESWEKEEIPVTLKNPGFLKPFEILLSFFPPPIYGTLDATFLLFLFPIFFGLIVGDIGYGVLMGALFFWVRKKAGANEQLKAITTIGFWCSAWSIVFGFVFGEAFGSLAHGILKPIWNDRLLITTEYLILSIIIGIVHIYVGLCLGFYLGMKEGHGKHAWEKLGFILILTGALMAIASQMAQPGTILAQFVPLPLDVLMKSGLTMMGAAVVLLAWAAGIAGIIEIFSLMSNVLSYARIMAIGIASVALAEVANEFGGAGGFFAIVIAVAVHGINLVLAIFDPTIQGLRLHYVEFFTKFYQSGGRAFEPLKKRG